MTRKFKVIILLICILIIVFYIIIKLSDMIKKREKLFYDNYTISNILKIELMINDPIILGSYGESYTIELINKKDIKNFMNFINSLELIEKDNSLFYKFKKNIIVHIYSASIDNMDVFSFYGDRMIVFKNGYDWDDKKYKVMNSDIFCYIKNMYNVR